MLLIAAVEAVFRMYEAANALNMEREELTSRFETALLARNEQARAAQGGDDGRV